MQEQLNQLERDLDGEAMRTQLVIGLDGASRIQEGDEAEIFVDSSKMHLFDPSTGENLTLDVRAPAPCPATPPRRPWPRSRTLWRRPPSRRARASQSEPRLSLRRSSGAGLRVTFTPPMIAKPLIRTTGLFSSSSAGRSSDGPA